MRIDTPPPIPMGMLFLDVFLNVIDYIRHIGVIDYIMDKHYL